MENYNSYIGEDAPEHPHYSGIEDFERPEPECSASEEEKEDSGIECEFISKENSWWCTTHNCYA